MKFRTAYTKNPMDSEKLDPVSRTIQDDSYTIKEILEKFTQGVHINIEREPYYNDDQESMEAPIIGGDFDLSDITEIEIQEIKETEENFKNLSNQESKKKEAELKSDSEEKTEVKKPRRENDDDEKKKSDK